MTDLKLIQSKASDDELKFGLFYPCGTVSGTAQLVQEFAAEFASSSLPGFNRGTGLLQNLANAAGLDEYAARGEVARALDMAVNRIQARQASQNLRNSERLQSASIRSIEQVTAIDWRISIDLISAAGDQIEFVI